MENILKSNGYLEPGFQDMSITEIEELLVKCFPTSTTRPEIFSGYLNLLNVILGLRLHLQQWINGSFCTNKTDPGDMDLLTLFNKDILDNMPADCQQIVLPLFQGPGSKPHFCCDSYLLIVLPENHPDYEKYLVIRRYWMGWFGFDRQEIPKGIIRINTSDLLPEETDPGGDNNEHS